MLRRQPRQLESWVSDTADEKLKRLKPAEVRPSRSGIWPDSVSSMGFVLYLGCYSKPDLGRHALRPPDTQYYDGRADNQLAPSGHPFAW